MKWTCRDGRVLDTKDMTTSHLTNVIAMLRRNNVVTPDEFLSCAAYAASSNTSDAASYAAEAEMLDMRPWKGLELLEEELARRVK